MSWIPVGFKIFSEYNWTNNCNNILHSDTCVSPRNIKILKNQDGYMYVIYCSYRKNYETELCKSHVKDLIGKLSLFW